jgi:signal transduction histidine kinase
VRLEGRDGSLLVQVNDDGRGLPQPLRLGTGLTSVHERAAALGGTTRITCRPGSGTRLHVTLAMTPCRA